MDSVITFPGLGLSFQASRVAFTIGGKPFYWYGIIIAVGFLLAVGYSLKRSREFGLTQDNIIDMLIRAVPLAIICARAYYCIFKWDMYKDNPISLLYIWEGGLAIYGGIIGAVLGLLLFTKRHKISTLAMMDIGGLGLLIGQCIGRWGNFINREAHGGVTDAFLRMGLTDAAGNTVYVHPTFLYESLWNLLGFVLLHFYSKRRKYDGQVFVMYLGWYGLGRMFIEGLRTDSLYLGNTNLRISQLVAGICVLFAAVFLFYNRVFREHEPEELYVNRVSSGSEEPSKDQSEPQADSEEETETEAPEADVRSDSQDTPDAEGENLTDESPMTPEESEEEDSASK